MATKKAPKAPPKKELVLGPEHFSAYHRLSEFVFLSAFNMVRSETVLLALVSKKLAKMTRCDGELRFQRVPHNFEVKLRPAPPEETAAPKYDLPTKLNQAAKLGAKKAPVAKLSAKPAPAPTAKLAAKPAATPSAKKTPVPEAKFMSAGRIKLEQKIEDVEEARRIARNEASARCRAKKKMAEGK